MPLRGQSVPELLVYLAHLVHVAPVDGGVNEEHVLVLDHVVDHGIRSLQVIRFKLQLAGTVSLFAGLQRFDRPQPDSSGRHVPRQGS